MSGHHLGDSSNPVTLKLDDAIKIGIRCRKTNYKAVSKGRYLYFQILFRSFLVLHKLPFPYHPRLPHELMICKACRPQEPWPELLLRAATSTVPSFGASSIQPKTGSKST